MADPVGDFPLRCRHRGLHRARRAAADDWADCLNLHCNRITQPPWWPAAGVLSLSSNRIEAMGGLHALVRLQTLDLACNRIRIIDGLAAWVARRLLLADTALASLAGPCSAGQPARFEAHGNRIALVREAEYLRGLPLLSAVVLAATARTIRSVASSCSAKVRRPAGAAVPTTSRRTRGAWVA